MPPQPNSKENPPQETPRPAVPLKNKGPLQSLRTFQGDMAATLQKTGGSVASVVIAEQKKKEREIISAPAPKVPPIIVAKNRVFVYFGSIFLGLGIITVIAVYTIRQPDPINIVEQNTVIGYAEQHILPAEPYNPSGFAESILTEQRNDTLPVNSILHLNVVSGSTTTPMVISDFLNLLGPTMPASLARAFDGKYMLGIYTFDTSEPFIILTASDYGQTYSGMLKWESSMVKDLGKIFSIPESEIASYIFEDESLKNKDLRVVKDRNRKTILLYSFLDKNTLVITKNEAIWGAVSAKYANTSLVR